MKKGILVFESLPYLEQTSSGAKPSLFPTFKALDKVAVDVSMCGVDVECGSAMKETTRKIIEIANQEGRITSADLAGIGASRTSLAYLAKRGILRRIARGVYVSSDHMAENETLQSVCLAVPHGVICLLSALQFHEITTQLPMEVWVAIERNRTVPQCREHSLRIVHIARAHFACGVEEHQIQGVPVRVYSPAKTVVDCFKFRNKIGLDIAREALKDSLAQGKATIDEIYRLANICRMLNVMRPYLEIVR